MNRANKQKGAGMDTLGDWELIIVWDTDDTDIYEYRTEEEATQAGRNMKIALGNQIAWWGTRKA